MERKLRIGIIGTGGIAHAHMAAYKQFDDVEIVGGADIVPGKAKAFFEKWDLPNAQAFESAEELIKNVEMDGVTICTYNTTHAECAIMALEAGLHVQCEKPMSFTLQEAVDMVKAAKKANKILTIGFQPRYSYMRQKVDEIIRSGTIGKVYYIQSGGGRRRGIPGGTFIEGDKAGFGCLGDIGCYSIDECLHAVGYPKPLTVSAVATDYFGKNPKYWPEPEKFNVDDFSVAFIRLEGDITFVFKQAWAMHADSLGDTLWLGTEGGIKIINSFDYANKPSRVMLFTDVNGMQVDSYILPSHPFDAYSSPQKVDVFAAKVRDFCDAIKEGRPAPIPGEEIIYNQAIIDGIYRSAKLKREVEIEIPEF
ncbi:MAG: Gfo/Idh/MocA family oxidoreductase [Clostridiales bacterium]|jgi:predicted dehydrogenase|nr:Gfo/Idh/MocA family oxidoreductase [Clostridiales bacterium]